MFNIFRPKQKEQSRIAEIELTYNKQKLDSLIIDLQFELSKHRINISSANLILFYVCHIRQSMESLNIKKLDFNSDKCQTLHCDNSVLSIKRESEEI